MKKIVFFTLVLGLLTASLLPVFAQVGINTKFPQGVFNIDAKGDNLSASPTTAQLANDVIINTSTDGKANMSLGGKALNQAQLNLLSKNKGMGLNIVELLSVNDKVTVPNPVDGMIVYNNGSHIENGVYLYTYNQWVKMDVYNPDPVVPKSLTFRVIANGVVPSMTRAQANALDYAKGVKIRGIGSQVSQGDMSIHVSGYYGFELSLSGYFTGVNEIATFYFFLVRKSDNKVLDSTSVRTVPLNKPAGWNDMLHDEFTQGVQVMLKSGVTQGDVCNIYMATDSSSDRVFNNTGTLTFGNRLLYFRM